MTSTAASLPADLRPIIAEALRAYELARATHLREEAVARAEQQRAAAIIAAINEAETAARALLERAGLAHIVGAPASPDGVAAPVRRLDQEVAAAFSAAQAARVELRAALLRLARAYASAEHWDGARRVAQPLLDDRQAPLYADALDLVCLSHYAPATAAFEQKDWETARQGFAAALKLNPAYRDTAALRRESYLRPARAAQQAGVWKTVQQLAEAWRAIQPGDAETTRLLSESYTQIASTALQSQHWDAARQSFDAAITLNAGQDETALRRERCFRITQAALNANQPAEALREIEPWWKKHQQDAEAMRLMGTAHYKLGLAAEQAQKWLESWRHFRSASSLYPDLQGLQEKLRSIRIISERGQFVRVGVLAHDTPVQSVAFSQDGTTIATATFTELTFWEVASLKQIRTHRSPTTNMSSRISNARISIVHISSPFTYSRDACIISGQCHIGDYNPSLYSFSYRHSPDKEALIQVETNITSQIPKLLTWHNTLHLRYERGKETLTFYMDGKVWDTIEHPGGINDVAIDHNNMTTLATASVNGTIWLWSAAKGAR